MNRIDADRLWSQVQQLLSAPPAPTDAELRRAARMLASSRADALELLLAQALARPRAAEAGPATAVPAVAAGGSGGPAPREQAPGLRQAARVAAGGVVGLAAGAVGASWLAGALDDDAPGLG